MDNAISFQGTHLCPKALRVGYLMVYLERKEVRTIVDSGSISLNKASYLQFDKTQTRMHMVMASKLDFSHN